MSAQYVRPRSWLALAGFLALCLAVGALAGIATVPNIAGWYATLAKPSFNPPNWVFAPVWTTLYVLMAVAAWRVWRKTSVRSAPLLLFFAQLALNFLWSFIFFNAHQIALALADIVVLWMLIAATTLSFLRVDRIAAALMAPYLAWVSFAALLNFEIYRLN